MKYQCIMYACLLFIAHAHSMDNKLTEDIVYEYDMQSTKAVEKLIYAYVNGRCAGTIQYSSDPCILYHKPHIRNLIVDDAYRKRGIGSELFLRALEDLQKAGCTEVIMHAIDGSESFYKKFGVRVIGRLVYSVMEFDFEKDGNPRTNRCKMMLS